MFGLGAIQLPSWARRRKAQMEEITSRVAVEAKLQSGASSNLSRIPDQLSIHVGR